MAPGAARRGAVSRRHETRPYDAEAAQRFWLALVQIHRVMRIFRARFQGKVSPVHFFWGAADLAVTRFSGREAPRHPGGAPHCADWVQEMAYSHEVSSCGYWPGGSAQGSFYSYAYPAPEGFADWAVAPAAASYDTTLGEFVLPYADVRQAADPEAVLLDFFQTTYDAAAELAHWDRMRSRSDRTGRPGGSSGGTESLGGRQTALHVADHLDFATSGSVVAHGSLLVARSNSVTSSSQ